MKDVRSSKKKKKKKTLGTVPTQLRSILVLCVAEPERIWMERRNAVSVGDVDKEPGCGGCGGCGACDLWWLQPRQPSKVPGGAEVEKATSVTASRTRASCLFCVKRLAFTYQAVEVVDLSSISTYRALCLAFWTLITAAQVGISDLTATTRGTIAGDPFPRMFVSHNFWSKLTCWGQFGRLSALTQQSPKLFNKSA